MNLIQTIQSEIEEVCKNHFAPPLQRIQIQPNNTEFEGDYTLVCFPLAKQYGKKPEEIAEQIGKYLIAHSNTVEAYHVVKGFLNLVIADTAWLNAFRGIEKNENFGVEEPANQEIVVEISSPNTNKPLHLGHLRNNFLGASVSALYEAQGYKVHKVQIINDRGIHICKSMVAWQQTGHGETPQSSGMKGDKLIGKYYVAFDKIYKQEIHDLIKDKGQSRKQAEKEAPIMQKAVHMLRQWEQKDPDVIKLWETMNKWVRSGFEATYWLMDVHFDEHKLYFESETYLRGKEEVLQGLKKGVFFKKEDGSVWVDLTDEGLDEKILLRSDGTSVYMTQDIGTAISRHQDFPNMTRHIYTVGNEQEYHFKVLFSILSKLGYPWAGACRHLSYGMVDLPSGKMKSREGTVVDADDLMSEMVEKAKKTTHELGKIGEMTSKESRRLFESIGIGALKYYLLKVDPRKRIVFNPEQSIQLHGHTGPFIQYTHARIKSILRKSIDQGVCESADLGTKKVTLVIDKAPRKPVFEFQTSANTWSVLRDEIVKAKYLTLEDLNHLSVTVIENAEKTILKHDNDVIPDTNFYLFCALKTAETSTSLNFEMSVVRKHLLSSLEDPAPDLLLPVERALIQLLVDYPERLREAAAEYNPALVANYVYDLAKAYNKLYQTVTILGEPDADRLKFRISLSRQTGEVIKKALGILQIEVPEKM